MQRIQKIVSNSKTNKIGWIGAIYPSSISLRWYSGNIKRKSKTYQEILDSYNLLIEEYDPIRLVSHSSNLIKAGIMDQKLFTAISQALKKEHKIYKLNPQISPALAGNFSKALFKDEELFGNISSIIVSSNLKELSSENINLFISSFGILEINDDVLFATLSDYIIKDDLFTLFGTTYISNILFAFAKLIIKDTKLFACASRAIMHKLGQGNNEISLTSV